MYIKFRTKFGGKVSEISEREDRQRKKQRSVGGKEMERSGK